MRGEKTCRCNIVCHSQNMKNDRRLKVLPLNANAKFGGGNDMRGDNIYRHPVKFSSSGTSLFIIACQG